MDSNIYDTSAPEETNEARVPSRADIGFLFYESLTSCQLRHLVHPSSLCLCHSNREQKQLSYCVLHRKKRSFAHTHTQREGWNQNFTFPPSSHIKHTHPAGRGWSWWIVKSSSPSKLSLLSGRFSHATLCGTEVHSLPCSSRTTTTCQQMRGMGEMVKRNMSKIELQLIHRERKTKNNDSKSIRDRFRPKRTHRSRRRNAPCVAAKLNAARLLLFFLSFNTALDKRAGTFFFATFYYPFFWLHRSLCDTREHTRERKMKQGKQTQHHIGSWPINQSSVAYCTCRWS